MTGAVGRKDDGSELGEEGFEELVAVEKIVLGKDGVVVGEE